MDRRRKPLTPQEQLVLRQDVEKLVESNPDWTLPEALKQIRVTLRLTQREMARVGKITTLTLQKIEAGTSNPTLATVEGLLRPFGLRLTISRSLPTTTARAQRRGQIQ